MNLLGGPIGAAKYFNELLLKWNLLIRKEKKMEKCFRLYSIPHPDFENYKIDKGGNLFDCSNTDYPKLLHTRYDETLKKPVILINNVLYDIHELILMTFYGILPNSEYVTPYGWDNVGYDMVEYKIDSIKTNKNEIEINGNQFKKLDEGEYYYLSENGVLYNSQTNKIVRLPFNNDGYRTIGINLVNYKIHRLVYKYYVEDFDVRDDNLEVHHKDLIKWNNHCSNLQLLTHEEHLQLHNRLRGYDSISDEVAIEIYRLHYEGKSNKEIEEITGVNQNTIRSIYLGNKKKRLFEQYKDIYPLSVHRRMNIDIARELVKDILAGDGFTILQQRYNTSKKAINKIKWGEHFPSLRKEFPELKNIRIPN